MPPPGVEMGAQVLDIAQRYRPDFVITHLFGRSPSVAIKELKRAGYPLSKVIGLVWASAEDDIKAAGGWGVAEGYHTMQFAGAGDDYPVRQEIKAMYKKQGKEPPKEMAEHGLSTIAGCCRRRCRSRRSATRSRRTAASSRPARTSRRASSRSTTLRSAASCRRSKITPKDHEGGGWVQVFTVKGGKFVKETDWFRAYRDRSSSRSRRIKPAVDW